MSTIARANARTTFGIELEDAESALQDCAALVAGALTATCGRWQDVPGPDGTPLDRLAETAPSCEASEDEALRLMARQAPVGRDLRRIVSLTRVARHLERTGALVRHVAEIRQRTDSRRLPDDVLGRVERMGWLVGDLLDDAVRAWRTGDRDLALGLRDRDEPIDHIHRSLLVPTTALGDLSVDVGLLSRHHERIADHAVALGDEVVFVVDGRRPGHDEVIDLRD